MVDLTLYVVVNDEGKYFRRKGYGGGGATWVDTPKTARVYVNLGGARGVVSFFANAYPKYPLPKILKLTVTTVEVLDEKERIIKQRDKKAKVSLRQEEYDAKEKLAEAEKELAAARERLKKARSKVGKGDL